MSHAIAFIPTQLLTEYFLYYSQVAGEAPWVIRVEEIKAAAAINLDAERKLLQMNEELQGLVRAIRTRVRTSRSSLFSWTFSHII